MSTTLSEAEVAPVPPASAPGAELALVHTKDEVRRAVRAARAEGKRRIALVPTMGYLHEGHMSLVDRARERGAEWVGMSIFVNPLQFGPSEDLDRYPRDLEGDLGLARSHGVDLVFAPAAAEVYPGGEPGVAVVPGALAEPMEGAVRPGHFRGVLTVVAKLFGIFTPDVAVFGQKDFQQAALIRKMVEELDFPVEIDVAPIVREADGLAMSSRNVYLSPEERESALALSRALERVRAIWHAGEVDPGVLRGALRNALAVPGVETEYAELADPRTLLPARRAVPGTVCLVAARVGRTRLIDNAVLE